VRDKYRQQEPADTATDNSAPKVEVNGHAEPTVTVAPESEAVRVAKNEASAADAASEVLRRQIESLRRSEQVRQQAAQPPTREQMLASVTPEWKTYLEGNPTLLDNMGLASQAAAHALQEGHQPNSEAQMRRTLELVERHLGINRAEETPPPAPLPPSPSLPIPTPAARHEDERQAAIVSAPVSREAPSAGDGSRSLNRVHLTNEERAFARTIGLSEQEYALQKRKMLQLQLSGEIQR